MHKSNRNQLQDLQNYTFISRYAQFLPEKKRRENYREAVARTKRQHETYFAETIKSDNRVQPILDEVYEAYSNQHILGSQRSLQFGGAAVLSKNARQYNCLKQNTVFITSEGLKSFADYEEGDIITVLTHTGEWKRATVRSYGKRQLYKIDFRRNAQRITVEATANHRWLLHGDGITDSLQIGQKVMGCPDIFSEFDFDSASVNERLYWCYGFVKGDGTLIKESGVYTRSLVRLCGDKSQFLERFTSLGFTSSEILSCKGDHIVYTGSYLKTLPDPSKDSPALIRAFIAGLMAADGAKNRNHGQSIYSGIQSSDPDVIEFLTNCSCIAGVHILQKYDLTGQQTNYGVRPYTVRFTSTDRSVRPFHVDNITPTTTEEVWCLEVEDNHSFVLEGGLVTGNCSATYVNRPRAFAEILYLLLCGTGVGCSVQKHHIAWLPKLRTAPKAVEQVFVIPDTIEGWSDALDFMINCYLQTDKNLDGINPIFDYSQIREKGSKFSHGVGRAPGPDGLRQSLERIKAVLDACVAAGHERLRPIDAYDIIAHASDAVLSGGVRRSALLIMFSVDDEEMMNAKTGDWFHTNPQRARSNNSAVLLRGKTPRELFRKLMQRTKEFGEPGFIWVNSLEDLFNPCFAGDTLVLTREGPRQIKDLVGKTVEIHDGNQWLPINTFTQTAINQKLLAITLQDGTVIKSTYNHKFIKEGGEVCEAWNLVEGDKLEINNPVTTAGNIINKAAYFLGFMTADGWGNEKGDCGLSVYYPKSNCLNRLVNSLSTIEHGEPVSISNAVTNKRYDITGIRSRNDGQIHNFGYGGKINIPKEVWLWDKQSQVEYIAGVMDGDGTVVDTQNGFGYQISSVHKSWLQDFQILLKTFGVYSKISMMHEAGPRDFGKSRGGIYNCQTTWWLTIAQTSSQKLSSVVKFERLKSFADRVCTYSVKPKWNIIVSIEELDQPEDVYCCYVHTNNQFTLGCGILSRQCVEVLMYGYDTTDPNWKETPEFSGVQMCNLTTINGRFCRSKEHFHAMCRLAGFLGTFQAAYTKFDYLGKRTENIVAREALLGVSITGIMDNPHILLDPKNLRDGAKIVMAANKELAAILGINPSPRNCNIKPEGSSASMVGSASGIHGWHSRNFIRCVQANKAEIPGQFYALNNPQAVAESIWSATKSDNCIRFACSAPDNAKFKSDFTAVEFLDIVKLVQQNWVMEGTDHSLSARPGAYHNVSNTVVVQPGEWDAVEEMIFTNQDYYTGVSLLGSSGDKDYEQAPFCEVKTEQEICREYNIESGAYTAMTDVLSNVCRLFGDPWKFTNYVKGYTQFTSEDADRMMLIGLFQNDPKGLTLMKEIWLNQEFTKLRNEYCTVDYGLMYEEDNNTTANQDVACGGGACVY